MDPAGQQGEAVEEFQTKGFGRAPVAGEDAEREADAESGVCDSAIVEQLWYCDSFW